MLEIDQHGVLVHREDIVWFDVAMAHAMWHVRDPQAVKEGVWAWLPSGPENRPGAVAAGSPMGSELPRPPMPLTGVLDAPEHTCGSLTSA